MHTLALMHSHTPPYAQACTHTRMHTHTHMVMCEYCPVPMQCLNPSAPCPPASAAAEYMSILWYHVTHHATAAASATSSAAAEYVSILWYNVTHHATDAASATASAAAQYVSILWNSVGVLLVVLLLPLAAPTHQSATWVFTHFDAAGAQAAGIQSPA